MIDQDPGGAACSALVNLCFSIFFLWQRNPHQSEGMAHAPQLLLPHGADLCCVCRRHQSNQIPHHLSSSKCIPPPSVSLCQPQLRDSECSGVGGRGPECSACTTSWSLRQWDAFRARSFFSVLSGLADEPWGSRLKCVCVCVSFQQLQTHSHTLCRTANGSSCSNTVVLSMLLLYQKKMKKVP